MKTVKKKSLIINSIIMIIITAFTIFYFFKDGLLSIETLSKIKVLDYLLVFLSFFFWVMVISLVDKIIFKSVTDKMPYHKCLVNTCFGNLGSNVTPLKSAHFPLKIYYQVKQGLTFNQSLTATVKCQIIYSITSITIYLAVFLHLLISGNSIIFYGNDVPLWTVALVGFSFHILVFSAIILLSFFKKLQDWFLEVVTKFLFKIKKITDIDAYKQEQQLKLSTYKEQIIEIAKHFHKYICPSLLYVLEMAISGSFQYIAYLLFTGSAFNFSDFFAFYVLNLATTYITNIIPAPGGGGGAEVLFTVIFASVIGNEILGAILILWRVSTYYLVVIFEFIVFILFSIMKGKRQDKVKELDTLNKENLNE